MTSYKTGFPPISTDVQTVSKQFTKYTLFQMIVSIKLLVNNLFHGQQNVCNTHNISVLPKLGLLTCIY